MMADTKTNTYTQGLMDTISALSKEVANLRTAYDIIHQRIQTMSALADRTTGDAVKEAIDIEELARLAVVAADVAHKAAVVLIETGAIEKAQSTLTATENAYESAQKSTHDSQARQTDGGTAKS
jgi:hypothetical protein